LTSQAQYVTSQDTGVCIGHADDLTINYTSIYEMVLQMQAFILDSIIAQGDYFIRVSH